MSSQHRKTQMPFTYISFFSTGIKRIDITVTWRLDNMEDTPEINQQLEVLVHTLEAKLDKIQQIHNWSKIILNITCT